MSTRIVAALLLSLAGGPAFGDEVILKNGSKIEGVVHEKGNKVVIEVDGGTVTLDRFQVDKIVRSVSPLEEFATKLKEIKEGEAEGFYKLGVWAREHRLDQKARQMFERVLASNPDHEGARKALGFYKLDNKWMTEDELMVALGFVRRNGEWLKKETVEKIISEESALERERESNASNERIAGLEADLRRLEIAAQAERDRLLAENEIRLGTRIVVWPFPSFRSVGGLPCLWYGGNFLWNSNVKKKKQRD